MLPQAKFFIDSDGEFATIWDNGTEDYFGGAWCFHSKTNKMENELSFPFHGLPLTVTQPEQGLRLP